MIFSTSLPRFKAFLGTFSPQASDLACCLLFIIPIILPAARSLRTDRRKAGWLRRWLGSRSAPAALLAAAQYQLQVAAHTIPDRLHVPVIDSTRHGRQGQHTQNTFAHGNARRRPRPSERHQKSVRRRRCHGFVFALLLTPRGLRIPYWLPFYTKQHGALFGRRHRSQASLA